MGEREGHPTPFLCRHVCLRAGVFRCTCGWKTWGLSLAPTPRPPEPHVVSFGLCCQIAMYESELERAHGQMLEEMQSLEEDKNRAIEEAFARAQVEMKAVHENLAGEAAAWVELGFGPAPRRSPSPCLLTPLRPCRCPDQPADAAASSADPHQRLQRAQAAGARFPPATAGGPQERQGRGECRPWGAGPGEALEPLGRHSIHPGLSSKMQTDKAPR